MTVAGKPPQPTDKLSGLIDRVTYCSETTGFAVLKVKARARSHRPWRGGCGIRSGTNGDPKSYYGVASGSVYAIASDAQLVPAAEIHWLRPNGNPLSK